MDLDTHEHSSISISEIDIEKVAAQKLFSPALMHLPKPQMMEFDESTKKKTLNRKKQVNEKKNSGLNCTQPYVSFS